MKKIFLCVLVCMASKASFSQTHHSFSNYKKTFQLLEHKRGAHCQNPASVFLKWKNTSSSTMDIQYAIEDKNGKWQTGIIKGVRPGEDTGDQVVYCNSSGRYKWWARPSDKASVLSFPSEAKLNKHTHH